ncbi:hypothetical protein TTHERM_00727600 (macronuclear) [Tetrahymena thermophila SB210]|uniref:Uncharacterized protein n=1 Tax=Tetrahymena thermophila (strain SB210) TaxID=312017 RepID=I7M9P0_TETTS|nr:hypothetical protein TTHERM_00727600 [Tetrahymena thermophila SB210]EAS02400.2 hypothetical protein TTHERM_00727600 [Tetrahymena thermophila SB210]|eukprot:XP_001022645.2 hypothetical protein TTHERM_00727600 [Tetrahymena thermophila SB210]
MKGLSKEKRQLIEEKSKALANLKMNKFSTLGLTKEQINDKKNKENERKKEHKKQQSQQTYNITPLKSRSMSYRDDSISRFSSQIKQINDLSEEEHQSVILKSDWMIPKEKKPHGEEEDIKVSPFVKYHPAILEMKVKSQDKRGYLLQEHQRLKKAEKQYLENLKDSRQFSLNNTQNHFSTNMSKLNRTFNSITTAGTDRRKMASSLQKQRDYQHLKSDQVKGYTVPIKFNEGFDDCLNKLQQDLKTQSQIIEEENRISRLIEKQQKKNNQNYINIQIQSDKQENQSSAQPQTINSNLQIPLNQLSVQHSLSDDESICSTDKHKQKLNELLCFSVQNIEYSDSIHNYGQNFGKYPKFYQYLQQKNSKAQQEKDFQNLKIYHQQFIKKNDTNKSQNQSPGISPTMKKKGIFSQDYKKFGESVNLEDIPSISQFLQYQKADYHHSNSKDVNSPQKNMYGHSQQFSKSNTISPQKIKSDEQKIKFQQDNDKIFNFNSQHINQFLKKGSSIEQSNQYSIAKSIEGIQLHKSPNQNLQRKNTIRENEEKSQKFMSAFDRRYPYILKKLKQIYKEEKTTKPFTKNYDEVFLSIYDSLSRANDHPVENTKQKKNK